MPSVHFKFPGPGMSHTQKAIGILIGVILLLIIFWLFFYNPVSRRLEDLQEESRQLEKQIVESGTKVIGLPEVEEKIVNSRRRLDQLSVQYPRSIEVVYQTITTAARETELRISRRETSERPIENQAFRIYEINIIASCSYQVLGEFLDKIISSPILISVSSLNISAESAEENGSGGLLQVEMLLTTYLSKTNGS